MNDAMKEAAERDAQEFHRRYEAAGGKLFPPKTLEEAIEMTEHERCAHYLQAKMDDDEVEAARLWGYITEIAARRERGSSGP